MINKKLVTSIILSATVAVSAVGQEKIPVAAQKSLKQAYKGKFWIGAADDLRMNSETYQASIKKHYDIVTPENCMKPERTHPTEDTYTFETADAMVDWCMKNDVKVWGHTLAWHGQTPQWFFQEKGAATATPTPPPPPPTPRQPGDTSRPRRNPPGFIPGPLASKEVVLERLKKHIMTVAGRYKGRITGWDVFNESIADGGDGSTENLRTWSWYKAVGPEVITQAFKWAHEADPKAQLYYNDYNIEQGAVENKGKHASSLLLLKRLLKEGAPITGVGIQGHWHLNTNLADVEKAIENYAALGLKVSITELDVTATGSNSGAMGVNQGDRKIPAENYEKQAEVYKKLFEIFMRHEKVIDRVTFWGLSDTRSWRRGQDALLFDGELNAKPAFTAVLEASKTK
ncbi:endo-1,4-beta-xylanase [Segetibacter sp. 3557_3]|uniref:endo-1,4-beta-xylanase n=1 Tax=Segetibacter sp. 3557_3 TaxID=2547429 RepID=UPI0010589FF8|nr:endo-1,4-beta-xylanase [Segetibacter sp. 3557_3]TDH23444.1 endo-1,4-beta-xylanase [Segetibacter sp. 3557_3]